MGKLNEIQEQTTQSWGDNAFTTSIKVDTVEFDSLKDKFTFKDPVEVPGLKINGTAIATFDAEDKAKLDSLTSTMQVKGRIDDVSDLPTEGASVGDVYLVGLSGDENFEEYVCTEISGSPVTPVWENLGHVKVQSDWNQSNISADNYIKNKPAVKAGQGENSIAEGNLAGNSATGKYSHAEGSYTTTSGNYSHAEGGGVTASGASSHAEGGGTTASGPTSHAEGGGTKAIGQNSHAEGGTTTASGGNSHAEGSYTTASGDSSHTEGVSTKASRENSHAEGNRTTASGNSSHAEGEQTTASGSTSHAEGSGTTATGDSSHTEGLGTIANNKCQHVFGEYNGVDPSSALSSARGTYIEIVGNGANNTARSNARTLDWQGNETLSGNLTIGGTITANGQQITPAEPQVQADWNQTTSTGSDYILNKPVIKAGQGYNSIIEGDSSTASGNYSHAEGVGTKASGDKSHAECFDTTASGIQSHAEGVGTTASGDSSHAEGDNTTASGMQSHAEGQFTTASGASSHAEGYQTTASGKNSHAEGTSTTANHKSQHVFGEYNIVDPSLNGLTTRGTYIEIVGNGATSSTKSNARTLDWSGNETLAGNLTIGGTITANGQQILPQKQADWNQATSTGSDYIKNKPAIKAGQGVNSIIEGDLAENSSTGNYSHTEGAGTTASGIATHTEGVGTTASGTSSHAEGYNTTANHKSQHVFGEFNTADPSAAASDARGTYIEIVGKGVDENTRSNARTLDWSGNETLTGTLTIGGASGATLKVESGALKVSFDGGTTWLAVSAS